MKHVKLEGLVAAVHTPLDAEGSLALDVVERQAEHLVRSGILHAFVAGTTGESHSLSLQERRRLATRWLEVARGTPLRVVVHVGSNCLEDARELAAQAAGLGAAAVAALSPSYFKPASVEALVECCARIASAAPEIPFYYYEIPILTGVSLPMPEFLPKARERMPNLAGLKFTNPDLMAYQLCLRAEGGAFDVPWGLDELFLAASALGAKGAVGSSYNFTGPIFHRLLSALKAGDLEAAADEQYRGVQVIQALARHGYLGAAKAVMGMLGVDVGPPRLPNRALPPAEVDALRRELETLGFFDWIRR
jgi:N-acetylneuraminate lyase